VGTIVCGRGKLDGVFYLYLFWYMGRKKRVVEVEGAILDLTGLETDDTLDIDALIAAVEVHTDNAPNQTTPKVTKTDEDLLNDIYEGHHCTVCMRSIFSDVKIWKGQKICANCHKPCRKKEYPPEVTEYVKSVYRRGCSFCDIRVGIFHLDHINMFSKVDSVYGLMEAGAPADDIIAEINKCQLLCVNCHGLVTKFETKRGFISDKRRLNKKIAAGEDVTELRKKLSDIYERVMTKMYPLIREKAIRIWGEPVVVEE
jgi:hypothetical protein